MRLILTGATGLIGSEVLKQALLDPETEELITLTRQPPGPIDPKLRPVIHPDFSDYSGLEEYFRRADALIWCLGISQTQVSRKEYERITFDFLDSCVRFCKDTNPSIRFVFVSGNGADRTGKSRTLFRRLKGKAENALLASGLSDILIARPDAVRPRQKNKRAPFAYKLAYPFFPLVEMLAPKKIIWSDVLGKALLRLAKNGFERNTLENADLRELGK